MRYPGNLRYIEHLDVVVICAVEDRTLVLVDVIGKEIPQLVDIYPHIGTFGVEQIEFLFVPDKLGVKGSFAEVAPSSHLFVRGPFALENTSFRFPETSQA